MPEKNKSAVQEFLEESPEKEVNPFEENLKDPFEKTIEIEPKVEEKVEEEKPLPFHKDPKVQKYLDKEIEKRLATMKAEPITRVTDTGDDGVTDVLNRLIGNDTPEKVSMVKEFKTILEKGTQRARDEAIQELENRQKASIQADQEAEAELENAFDTIEESYGVDITSNAPIAKKTRQEFVEFVEKIAPKDRNGDIIDYPDMNSAWETFSELKKSTQVPNRAKELASSSMKRSAEVSGVEKPKASWETADAFIESLGK